MEILHAQAVDCYHCGEACPSNPPQYESHSFCCEGCKSVYQLLSSCDLATYYELQQQPGSTITSTYLEEYEWLDEPSIQAELIDFTDDFQCHVHFTLPQIHCSSCIWLLENLARLLPAVSVSRVNFPQKSLSVVFDPQQTSLREVVATLAQIGYPPELSISRMEDTGKTPASNSRLIRQLGIAGFCFGNIMLLSFPEYLGLAQSSFSHLFAWLSVPLALLTLAFGATDYLKSAFLGLRMGHINMDVPISIGILALAGQSFYEIFVLAEPGYLDSLSGFIFFLLIGKWFQQKSLENISFDRTYTSFFPLASRKKSGEGFQFVSISELEKGDQLQIRHQEILPADAILESLAGEIDYSFVTGESRPVQVKAGDLLYAGGRVMGTSLEVRLSREVSNSYLTQLWENQETDNSPPIFAQQLIDKTGTYFTWVILLIASLGFVYWWQIDSSQALRVAISVLIIACPCAIALTIPFTLGNARRMLWKHGLITRTADTLIALSKVTHIIFDKTGTLTHKGSSPMNWEGERLSDAERSYLASLVGQSIHPISLGIENSLQNVKTYPVLHFEEQEGLGIQGEVEGHQIKLGSLTYLTGEENANGSGTWLEIEGRIRGSWQHQLRIRGGILSLLKQLGQRFSLSLLSGDSSVEAEKWEDLIGTYTSRLSFRQTPFDKLASIRALQENGEHILMVGDGLNDAGALRQSNVGMAISEDSSYFAPACDSILQGKDLAQLDTYLAYTRLSVRLVYAGFLLATLYNLIGLYFALNGWVTPVLAAILMPLSSLSLIAFAMASTTLLAKVLGLGDKSHPHP